MYNSHMKKHFYSHIIEIDSLFVEMDLLDMEKHEREELILIIESSVHHLVLDIVLSKLPEEDKRLFLSHLTQDRHDDIWELLHTKTKQIDKHIREGVDKLKQDMHKDISRAKAKKHKNK